MSETIEVPFYPDVMVDFETTGVHYEHCAILQISAVKFNLADTTIHPVFFDRCLNIPVGRYWEEDCRNWWMKRKDVIANILQRGEEPKNVLTDFVNWAVNDHDHRRGALTFWSKPTHFDFSFMQSYLRQFDVVNPFHYRMANDVNSWIRARYFPEPPREWEKELPFEGQVHNAIDDVLHQIKVLMHAYHDTKK